MNGYYFDQKISDLTDEGLLAAFQDSVVSWVRAYDAYYVRDENGVWTTTTNENGDKLIEAIKASNDIRDEVARRLNGR